jgi:hypothetical protein
MIELDDKLIGATRMERVFNGLQVGDWCQAETGQLPTTVGMVTISAEKHFEEALAAAQILKGSLKTSHSDVCCLSDYEADTDHVATTAVQARAVIVLMSGATLTSPDQLSVICNVMDARQQAINKGTEPLTVIPVQLPSFRFPTSDRFYTDILAKSFTDVERNMGLIQSFLQMTAIPFPTGSEAILELYIEQVRGQIPAKADKQEASSRRITTKKTQDMTEAAINMSV